MFDYKIIDNFFDDPDAAVTAADEAEYSRRTPDLNWSGYRTIDEIYCFNPELFQRVCQKSIVDVFGVHASFNYRVSSFFHKLPDEAWPDKETWWHKDPSIYAGVIYLTKNPPKNTGTILNINDSIYKIENKFNRLVFYRGNIPHRAENAFGNLDDSPRLTLTFFVHELHLRQPQ